MNIFRRPVAVMVVSCLFLLVGALGFIYHFQQLQQPDGIWVELTEALAIVAGAFMLLGHNWARWLALAWMAFHVALSAFGALPKLAIHSIIFIGIAWLLFLPDSRRYFAGTEKAPL